MATSLIQEEELMEWSGFKRRSALVSWLRQCGIPYLLGNGGRVCVTAESVNLPLLRIRQELSDSSEDIEF